MGLEKVYLDKKAWIWSNINVFSFKLNRYSCLITVNMGGSDKTVWIN